MGQVDAVYVKEHLGDGQTKILNVLGPDEFRKRHVPGSVNIPVDSSDFQERVRENLPELDQAVIVHCSSPESPSSTRAVHILESMGYTRVHDFKAGIQGWLDAGEMLEGSEATYKPMAERLPRGRRPSPARGRGDRAVDAPLAAEDAPQADAPLRP